MGKLKKLGERSVRIICDCGKFAHDLSADDKGKMSLDTIKLTPDEEPKTKEKAVRSIFDSLTTNDDDDEN